MSNQRTFEVIAHRGASADHPENTVAAFTGAREQGADWVELDVRLSSDGALVVHHDPVYPDTRPVAATSAGERPAQVPLLAEALDACAGMGINIEIKNTPGELGHDAPHDLDVADRVCELVAERRGSGLDRAILVTSFDEPTLARVRTSGAAIDTGLLVWDLERDPGAVERAAAAGHVAINPWDPFVDEDFMARSADAGLRVNVWTVDDPERILGLAALGVHGIITNVPALARSILG